MSNVTTAETLDIVKIGLEVLSVVSTLAIGYIALTIRNVISVIKLDQARNKAELTKHVQDTKDELTKESREVMNKVFSIDASLASHIVQDTERFSSIGRTLNRQDEMMTDQGRTLHSIESKVDRNYAARSEDSKRD